MRFSPVLDVDTGSRLECAAPCPALVGEPRISRVRQGRGRRVVDGGWVRRKQQTPDWVQFKISDGWVFFPLRKRNTEKYHIIPYPIIQVSQHITSNQIIIVSDIDILSEPEVLLMSDVCPWETPPGW